MTASVAKTPIHAEDRVELSPEDQRRALAELETLKKALSDGRIKAKFKLELIFGKARSTHKPTPGMLTWWENGTRFHGGGDVKIYRCPGKYRQVSECAAHIPDLANSEGTLICSACGQSWRGSDVIGEIFWNLPMRKWAEVLYAEFRRFDYNCDIYLKHAPEDIRSLALAQADKPTHRVSEKLDRARARRARHIYPLSNIIKDTAAGADLLNRIYTFLVA